MGGIGTAIENLVHAAPYGAEDSKLLAQGLRLAGLPEFALFKSMGRVLAHSPFFSDPLNLPLNFLHFQFERLEKPS